MQIPDARGRTGDDSPNVKMLMTHYTRDSGKSQDDKTDSGQQNSAEIIVSPERVVALEIKQHIFREYDIRGRVGEEISDDIARLLGAAYGDFLAQKGIVTLAVGRDCRLSSSALAAAFMEGVLSRGCDIVDLGLVPTPLVYFATHFDPSIKAGAVITGSHNPAEYNGFKLSADGKTLTSQQIQELYFAITSRRQGLKKGAYGKLRSWDPVPPYLEHLCRDIILSRPLTIALDAGNGAASVLGPKLYAALGCKVIPLYCEFDGSFPNHFPDPTVPENLSFLQTTVTREKVAAGLAFDGDADRLGAVDPTGEILPGDLLLCIFARDILRRQKGAKILGDVKCSNLLFQDIAHQGGKPIMWKTGHSLIKAKLREENAALAGEMSGHFFFADRYYGYDDALYAGARLLQILSEKEQTPLELLADLPKTHATPELRVECREEEKFPLVKAVTHTLKKRFDATLTDGIRICASDTDWALIRASNTQPVIVMRFEASTKERLQALRTCVEEAVANALEMIRHEQQQS